ncbi:hypothetical protein JK361_38480 [Streptomyces sp. 5-8]|uniref:Asp23/Gls24 family envelope stress response protein n=1 Tax=Streptomyces musisoli TaxID=2802280 RepID=A0ABS1PDB4_9ACTN|nr:MULTISPECIES: hypothetical protein [Streptomyces]MBL1110375.1 hypothetical protein [Streptomyces musisoli]MBY8846660.1 hypothetical protein [Streptomyces sp. SP2-10]
MAALGTADLITAAERAALATPGVTGLQPFLARRLTEAVSPVLPPTIPERAQTSAGVRAEHAPGGSGWSIEVRCMVMVTEGHRVLDTARIAHDQIQSAVQAHLAEHGAQDPVTVTVTVTRITVPPAGRVP